MTTLTLQNLSEDQDCTFHHEATAETFSKAALQLLTEIETTYSEIPQEIFEGLGELASGEEEYTHIDFSTPEDNFKLTSVETKPVAV